MDKYLQIENAEMVFNTKKGRFTALTGVNLKVKQGEFIALIGHSGWQIDPAQPGVWPA